MNEQNHSWAVKWRRVFWNPVAGTVLLALVAFFLLAYPVYVIRPFRYQGAHELSLALILLRVRLALEIVLLIVALGLAVLCWRSSSRVFAKAVTAACVLLIAAFGFLSRVNIYELMFKPLDRISFSPASRAKLDADEQVIAIKVRSAARAYPIRSMSYHHIVNDLVADEPIVATY